MKKIISLILLATLALSVLTGCGAKNTSKKDSKKLVIGASSTPHAEILQKARSLMKEKGYDLDIKVFNDYVLPNTSLESGDLDGNYFQHQPYLDDFNKQKGTHLVSAAKVHYEPFGIYPGKVKSLKKLQKGDTIAVPNDTSNEARALLLLEEQGLIKLKKNAGVTATVKDITENPKDLKFLEIEAAQISRSLNDVAVGVINGNYALLANLDVEKDALATEKSDSVAAQTYANILVVKEGHENDPGIKALVDVLNSDDIRTFMKEKYNGAVLPIE